MPTPINEAKKLVARVRRVWGNDAVEVGGGSKDFLYRITSPNTGARVQIHGSPSDENWLSVIERQLRAAGFDRDEQIYNEVKETERLAKIERDRRENDKKIAEANRHLEAIARAAGPLGPQVADLNWLFSRHEFPERRRLLVPPELSRKILNELNTSNRPLKAGRVEYWANLMRRGKWAYTHQGIAFNQDGRLQDGQHRLTAAVVENFTLDIDVSVGMPSENFMKVDVGNMRSGADTMATEKKDFPTTLSGAAKLVYAYDRYGPEMRQYARSGGRRISNDDLSESVEKYGDPLKDAVAKARSITKVRDGLNMSSIALAAGVFLIGRHLRPEDARVKEFIRGYADGTNLSVGDSRIALRTYSTGLGDANRKVSVADQLGVFIKAWNAWASGRSISFLSIRKDEMMPTVFIPPRPEADFDE